MSTHEVNYGAATPGDELTQHFVSRGSSIRRRKQHLLIFSVAAISCACAVLFIVVQNRGLELIASPWLANEAPVPASQYAWGGLSNYHAALVKAIAGEPQSVDDSQLESDDSENEDGLDDDALDADLPPMSDEGREAYRDAVKSAVASHQDLNDLIAHYSKGHAAGLEALKNLEAAHELWRDRHKVLARLDTEIERERARMRSLEDDEAALMKHHARAASYVASLLSSSKNIGLQLKQLREYYESQLDSSNRRYEDAQYERKVLTEKIKRKLEESKANADDYNAQVSKSIAKASYYDGQVELAKAEERTMRDRAAAARGEAQSSKATLGVALTKALDEKVREQSALAEQTSAELKANAMETVVRQKSEANEDLYNAKAKLMEQEALAKADVASATDAKRKLDAAEEEERKDKTRLRLSREQLNEVYNMIIDEQTKAKTAQVRAALYESRTAAAQAALEDAQAKYEAMEGRVKDAIHNVEVAEGQAALAKTEAKLTEQSARSDLAANKEKVVEAERAADDSKQDTHKAQLEIKALWRKKQAALEDIVDKQAALTESQNDLELAKERHDLAAAYAGEVDQEVEANKADAQGLIQTVKDLTDAAREATAAAAAARASMPPPRPPPLVVGLPHGAPLPA